MRGEAYSLSDPLARCRRLPPAHKAAQRGRARRRALRAPGRLYPVAVADGASGARRIVKAAFQSAAGWKRVADVSEARQPRRSLASVRPSTQFGRPPIARFGSFPSLLGKVGEARMGCGKPMESWRKRARSFVQYFNMLYQDAETLTSWRYGLRHEGSDSRRTHAARWASPPTPPCLPAIPIPTTRSVRGSLSQSSQRPQSFQASPLSSRLATGTRRIRFVLLTDWQFASGCSPPRLTPTQLPSATWSPRGQRVLTDALDGRDEPGQDGQRRDMSSSQRIGIKHTADGPQLRASSAELQARAPHPIRPPATRRLRGEGQTCRRSVQRLEAWQLPVTTDNAIRPIKRFRKSEIYVMVVSFNPESMAPCPSSTMPVRRARRSQTEGRRTRIFQPTGANFRVCLQALEKAQYGQLYVWFYRVFAWRLVWVYGVFSWVYGVLAWSCLASRSSDGFRARHEDISIGKPMMATIRVSRPRGAEKRFRPRWRVSTRGMSPPATDEP